MKKLTLLTLSAALLCTACQRKKTISEVAPAVEPTPVTLTTPAQAAVPAPTGAEFESLNKALEQWAPINGIPKDLNVLVSAKMVPRLPPLPPGKRFAIDEKNLRVILVNQ